MIVFLTKFCANLMFMTVYMYQMLHDVDVLNTWTITTPHNTVGIWLKYTNNDK